MTTRKFAVPPFCNVSLVLTVFDADNAWHFLVSGWGDPEVLIEPGWSWIAVPLLTGIVSCTVQVFFAWRIYKISGTIWLPIPIVIIAFAQVSAFQPLTALANLLTELRYFGRSLATVGALRMH
jgi:hypothetical protein